MKCKFCSQISARPHGSNHVDDLRFLCCDWASLSLVGRHDQMRFSGKSRCVALYPMKHRLYFIVLALARRSGGGSVRESGINGCMSFYDILSSLLFVASTSPNFWSLCTRL